MRQTPVEPIGVSEGNSALIISEGEYAVSVWLPPLLDDWCESGGVSVDCCATIDVNEVSLFRRFRFLLLVTEGFLGVAGVVPLVSTGERVSNGGDAETFGDVVG